MSTVLTSIKDRIAVVTLAREKVNAINETLLDDFNAQLDRLQADGDVDGIVVTGRDRFFSFGFDVPELLTMQRSELVGFLAKHTATLLRMFTFDKPIVAAINGHAVAGGCMLILACDFRVAAPGRTRIGLNEIELGVSVFSSATEMLRYWVGNRRAELILGEGTMYSITEAERLGLIDEVVSPDRLMAAATSRARALGGKPKAACRGIKNLLRRTVASNIETDEPAALSAFVDTWYSEEAQSILSRLQIRTRVEPNS